MAGLELLLTTDNGNEIGRLPVPVQISAAPQDATCILDRFQITGQMERLYSAISTALTAERLATTLEPLPFQAAISQALTNQEGVEPILIILPVRAIDSGQSDMADVPTGLSAIPDAIALDDLFDISDLPAPGKGESL